MHLPIHLILLSHNMPASRFKSHHGPVSHSNFHIHSLASISPHPLLSCNCAEVNVLYKELEVLCFGWRERERVLGHLKSSFPISQALGLLGPSTILEIAF
uniref:Uncharacterized protein n=1 Tax=Sphaerodactylus townsendi TaxID=933632 RepID=A0ACB8F3K7_9SAUR